MRMLLDMGRDATWPGYEPPRRHWGHRNRNNMVPTLGRDTPTGIAHIRHLVARFGGRKEWIPIGEMIKVDVQRGDNGPDEVIEVIHGVTDGTHHDPTGRDPTVDKY